MVCLALGAGDGLAPRVCGLRSTHFADLPCVVGYWPVLLGDALHPHGLLAFVLAQQISILVQ